jgi:Zn-finger nucleic acid-binding protein
MMRTVDKNGVHIEQCEGCRGIFLDRGELEQIAGAERAYYGSPPPYAQSHDGAPPRGGYDDSPRPYRGGYGDSPRPYRGGYGDSPRPYQGRRKRGFLENLFD